MLQNVMTIDFGQEGEKSIFILSHQMDTVCKEVVKIPLLPGGCSLTLFIRV